MDRLSPLAGSYLVHGSYSFVLPDLAPVPSASCATLTLGAMTTTGHFGVEQAGGNLD